MKTTAYKLGLNAHQAGKQRVSGADPALLAMPCQTVGDAIDLMNAWNAGWDAAHKADGS
jgi:hypothetical protein